jgi:hypothetical protein
MSIVRIFSDHGIHLRKQGKTWGGNWCPHCGESSRHSNKLNVFVGRDEKERWKCLACGERGDAADLLMLLKGINFKDAAREAGIERGEIIRREPKPEEAARQTAINEVVSILLAHARGHQKDCMSYLVNTRSIHANTIQRIIDRNMMRCLPGGLDWRENRDWLLRFVGRDKLVEAGLWHPDKKAPALAFRPLLFILPSGTSFEARTLQAREGSPKSIRYGRSSVPYWLPSQARTGKVFVVEGMPDFLSVSQLYPSVHVLGIPGSTNWNPKWIGALKQRYGESLHIACGTDDDDAGNLSAQRISLFCRNAGVSYSRELPPIEGDWNDFLKQETRKDTRVA